MKRFVLLTKISGSRAGKLYHLIASLCFQSSYREDHFTVILFHRLTISLAVEFSRFSRFEKNREILIPAKSKNAGLCTSPGLQVAGFRLQVAAPAGGGGGGVNPKITKTGICRPTG